MDIDINSTNKSKEFQPQNQQENSIYSFQDTGRHLTQNQNPNQNPNPPKDTNFFPDLFNDLWDQDSTTSELLMTRKRNISNQISQKNINQSIICNSNSNSLNSQKIISKTTNTPQKTLEKNPKMNRRNTISVPKTLLNNQNSQNIQIYDIKVQNNSQNLSIVLENQSLQSPSQHLFLPNLDLTNQGDQTPSPIKRRNTTFNNSNNFLIKPINDQYSVAEKRQKRLTSIMNKSQNSYPGTPKLQGQEETDPSNKNLTIQRISPSKFRKSQEIIRGKSIIQHQKPRNTVQNIVMIGKIIRFSQKMKEYSNSLQFKRFLTQPFLYTIIADNAHYIMQDQPFKVFNRIVNIINPHSAFWMTWTIIKFLVILFQMVLIPLQNTILYERINIITVYQFLLILITISDILLTFNVGVYIEGLIITNRQQIAKNYLKKTFFIDFIAFSGFLITYITQDSIYLYMFLIHILQLFHVFNNIDNFYQIQQKFNSLYEFLILVFTIIYIGHIGACIFYQVAIYEMKNGNEQNWIEYYHFSIQIWQEIYLESLYFSFITMVTVGYGDLTPQTKLEKIVTILLTLVSCGIFAFAVTTIGQIFTQKHTKTAEIKMKKYKVSQYMNKRNINKLSKMKVIKALEYTEQQEEKGNLEAQNIIKQISKGIQDEIFLQYYSGILKNTRLFKICKFSEDFTYKLASKMMEITASPDQQIQKQNFKNDKFYILMEGNLQIYFQGRSENSEENEKTIQILKDPIQTEIGYKQLFTQGPSPYSIRSQNVSRLVYYTYEDWQYVLNMYPQDKEKFQLEKDKMLLDLNSKSEQCLICFSYSHSSDKCSQIHPISNNQIVIKRSQQNISQIRQRYYRSYQQKHLFSNVFNQFYTTRNDLMSYRVKLIKSLVEDFQVEDYQLDTDKDFFFIMPRIVFTDNKSFEICKNNNENKKDDIFFIEDDLQEEQEYLKTQNKIKIEENFNSIIQDNSSHFLESSSRFSSSSQLDQNIPNNTNNDDSFPKRHNSKQNSHFKFQHLHQQQQKQQQQQQQKQQQQSQKSQKSQKSKKRLSGSSSKILQSKMKKYTGATITTEGIERKQTKNTQQQKNQMVESLLSLKESLNIFKIKKGVSQQNQKSKPRLSKENLFKILKNFHKIQQLQESSNILRHTTDSHLTSSHDLELSFNESSPFPLKARVQFLDVELDQMQIFTSYYPNYNYQEVISKYRKRQHIKIKSITSSPQCVLEANYFQKRKIKTKIISQ